MTLLPADASADGPSPEERVARGGELYGRYCALCHGKRGEGYAADEAPRLANDDLLAIASDDFLIDAILSGRPGTTMSAWSLAQRGPIGGDDATAIVAFLRSWQTRPKETPPANVPAGSPERGAPLYAKHCASCHGGKGVSGKYGFIAGPTLLAAASDGFLSRTIETGRTGTPMPAFRGTLDGQGIADVVALLRSWQKPLDEKLAFPPRPGERLTAVVVNPKGKMPPFDPKADFVKVDEVKRALDAGQALIIADARPPSDYARMHIGGAISVPFYEAAAYAKHLPKDRFVITYCGCPHAQSGKLRDALRGLGFKHVAVLDEGLNVWRDRGYTVRGGPKP